MQALKSLNMATANNVMGVTPSLINATSLNFRDRSFVLDLGIPAFEYDMTKCFSFNYAYIKA